MQHLPAAPKPPLWPLDAFSKVGPFAVHPGQPTRPLRITVDLPDDVREALEAGDDAFASALVSEFTSLPELDTAFTVPGEHPWLEIALDPPAPSYTVTFRDAKGEATRWTGVDEWEIWSHHSTFPRGGHLYRSLALAAAHASAHRELFVTLDPVLLAERHRLARANIVHPIEALPIIHLHLRMQPEFAYRLAGRSRFNIDRGMFFLTALRERTPCLWRLIWRTSTIPALHERLSRLGNAVRTKCIRYLEARDELALLFYSGDTDRDRSGYHFTYALLLLSGALDALAKVACLVYEPPKSAGPSAQRRVSFNLSGFRKKLQAWDVRPLLNIVTRSDFLYFCELVWRPRNRIHA